MTGFKAQIARHRDAVNVAHARVRATVRTRDRSDADRGAWMEACREFHALRSEIEVYVERVSGEGLADPLLRRFVFDYLSVDPVYFRSGYQKERLLKAVKRLELTDEEAVVLRQTILRRVRTGALREFRHLCRLMPQVQTDEFVAELRAAAGGADDEIRRRAAFALTYVAS
ncbi:MAG: hypothetical protein AAGA87_04935 [Pseudomonadota bacterium]